MEDLIFNKPSKILTFRDENVQASLISFENNISSRESVDLYFLLDLYDLKRSYCFYDVDDSGNSSRSFKIGTDSKACTFNEFMLVYFGLSKNYINRCIKVVKKFTTYGKRTDVGSAKFIYEGFTISKLFELLSVSDTQISSDISVGVLKPSMSIKEIRAYVKSLKGESKDNKVLEDNSSTEESDPFVGVYIKFEDECNNYVKKIIQSERFNSISEYINYLIKQDMTLSST